MQLAIWIIGCAALAAVLRRRPEITMVLVLGLWFLVPTVGSPLITGQPTGPLSFHAASWLILLMFVAYLTIGYRRVLDVLARHGYTFLALTVVVAAAIIATSYRAGGGGVVLLLDQIVAPILFFLTALAAGTTRPHLAVLLRNTMLTLLSAVCLVALAQWFTESVLFYESGFLTQYWFNPENQRWMGVLDQPLTLSAAVCILTPLLAGVRSAWLQLPLLLLFGTGVLISQSRVGVVVFPLVALYVVLFSRRRPAGKVGLLALVVAIGAYVFSTPLMAGVLGRVADDTGSADARAQVVETFFSKWYDYLFVGSGIGSSYGVAEESGLSTSMESSILMYSVDIGIVFAVLYFGVMAALVLVNGNQNKIPGLAWAGVLAVAIPQTYSALATRSALGLIVWAVLAMLAVAGDRHRAPALALAPKAADLQRQGRIYS